MRLNGWPERITTPSTMLPFSGPPSAGRLRTRRAGGRARQRSLALTEAWHCPMSNSNSVSVRGCMEVEMNTSRRWPRMSDQFFADLGVAERMHDDVPEIGQQAIDLVLASFSVHIGIHGVNRLRQRDEAALVRAALGQEHGVVGVGKLLEFVAEDANQGIARARLAASGCGAGPST